MKTFGKIIIILVAFTVAMGLTYTAVSASGSSTNTPQFESGERPALPSGQFDGRAERNEGGGSLIFGLMKNIIFVAFIVAVIVIPKSLIQQRHRAVPVRINQ